MSSDKDTKSEVLTKVIVSDITASNKKTKVLFAIDIEGSGSSYSQNGILAIGYCVGDMNGRILEKKRISLKLGKRTFEPRCKSQYWDVPAQAAQLKVFEHDGIDPHDGIKQFIEAVDRFENVYDVVILTDNPSYDVAWINYYLDHYLGRSPLAYMKDQITYRGVSDQYDFAMRRRMRKTPTGEWSFDMTKYKKEYELLKLSSPHDHWPENDAEAIFKKTLLLDSC